jgi:UDP-N-acetylmuramoyl-tripeptide--D-alanyl-D-alanine ligase
MNGDLIGQDAVFSRVSTDSRSVHPGELFVALVGPNFDGHDFIEAAVRRGAVGVIASRSIHVEVPHIVVADTLEALQRAGAAWRLQFQIPVVAVAGSNGKTTTKEMLAHLLAGRGPCHATRGTLNNHIGVPLTLLDLAAEHVSAVIEIGANHPKEVEALTRLVSPTIGLVTNAGAEHLEGFGDLDGVARSEGELFEQLPSEAVAVINADDPYADLWTSMAGSRRVIRFGTSPDADVRLKHVEATADRAGQRFTCETPQGVLVAELRLLGLHNVLNALGAVGAALAAGATLAMIADGLSRMRPVRGRLDVKKASCGALIIDDTYNANPSSFTAGLSVLTEQSGEPWLVLGEMAELGPTAADVHAAAGREARLAGVTRLFAVGAPCRETVAAFGAGGEWFSDVPAMIERLLAVARHDASILVKGSRVNRLERVVDALTVRLPDMPTSAAVS